MTPGSRLRELAQPGRPAQVAGVVSAYAAMLAERAGLPAIYLSGGATAASLGMPDLGVLAAADMVTESARITSATELPLLVDADTGYGNELAVVRAVRAIERSGAAGIHLEDQLGDKRCGHRPGKQLCTAAEMQDRLKAACDARADASFVVMARTDAIAVESLDSALERAAGYVEAGADMLFLEGATEPGQYAAATAALGVPVLANMTEFGVTPLLDIDQLAAVDIALALYPLTAFRTMMRAAEEVFVELRNAGGQQSLLDRMQTREELYERLGYHQLEQALDQKRAAKN